MTFVSSRRERERETPVTSFDITLKSRVIMHMITSAARRRVLSLSSARVHVKTKDKELVLALERSSSRVNDDREGEALRSLVSLP